MDKSRLTEVRDLAYSAMLEMRLLFWFYVDIEDFLTQYSHRTFLHVNFCKTSPGLPTRRGAEPR